MLTGQISKYRIDVDGTVTYVSGPDLRTAFPGKTNIIPFPTGAYKGLTFSLYGIDEVTEDQTLVVSKFSQGMNGHFYDEGGSSYIVTLACLSLIYYIGYPMFDICLEGFSITAVGTAVPLYIEIQPYVDIY